KKGRKRKRKKAGKGKETGKTKKTENKEKLRAENTGDRAAKICHKIYL
ncbi:TPA: hypothetical protein HA351_02355, partial [Methanosarcinaceae archaeon]|nr:hypothetical protein [Methanosarcinaceae archaeon]